MALDYSTDAIVLGSRKLGEADRIVDMFTANRGRVPTVVKGVRKVKSRWGGRLEPFTHLAVRLHEGRNLHTLTAADTVRTNAGLRDNPSFLKAGLSVAEMISRSTPELHRKPRTYNLLLNFLQTLGRVEDDADGDGAAVIALAAQLKMLLLAGFLPHLLNCAACNSESGPFRFSASAGGVICPDCHHESFPIAPDSINAMKGMLEGSLSAATGLDAGPENIREIRRAVCEICSHHLGIGLKVDPW